MAISHNLSDISNQLSCHDPVAGISGTIGKSWLMWKVFDALRNFDSNVKLITNSDPTPAFLQSEAGGLTSEPAQNRNTIGDVINFYFANDPGLTQNPKSAMIYTIKNETNSYNACFGIYLSFKIEGQTKYTTPQYFIFGNSSTESNIAYSANFYGTTTNLSLVPKLLLWKSNNANLIMGIYKDSGNYAGAGLIYNPAFSGYRTNIGAITEGLNFRATVGTVGNPGHSFYEGFTQTFDSIYSGLPSNLSPISSAGKLPTALLTWDGNQYAMVGKLRFGVTDGATMVAVSEEIDGLYLVNGTAISGNTGTIVLINGKYYLKAGYVSDGRNTYRIIVKLDNS